MTVERAGGDVGDGCTAGAEGRALGGVVGRGGGGTVARGGLAGADVGFAAVAAGTPLPDATPVPDVAA
jgi:hypothetical protein